jgi:hypothetical protein
MKSRNHEILGISCDPCGTYGGHRPYSMDDRAIFVPAVWRICTLDFGAGNTTLIVKCEGSTDGKSWAPTFEGKATKK